MESELNLHPSWLSQLSNELKKDYMQSLIAFIDAERKSGKTIYPAENQVFAALNMTALETVKVVILGQDPYHGPNQAHGLSFSVPQGEKVPPSLRNIYKELSGDLGLRVPTHGFLKSWADQGVLLLNSVLTVRQAEAGSHQGKGWETFTDAIIDSVNREQSGVVFMLWGAYAQKKGSVIDTDRHLILKASHPSPLSAHRGFLGCQHFSRANTYLKALDRTPINWQI
ncbi:uracil-DNA glycosylase [Arenicella sp. 4NH20-0111]|uniref:uracil-DNA glycosylase n=1 Tax=Arenicella sp. 4NH20-0111 TaxID=3127648 RepID=UPI0033404A5D